MTSTRYLLYEALLDLKYFNVGHQRVAQLARRLKHERLYPESVLQPEPVYDILHTDDFSPSTDYRSHWDKDVYEGCFCLQCARSDSNHPWNNQRLC